MRQTRLNWPLWAGLFLTAGLLLLVVLPWCATVAHPNLSQLVFTLDGTVHSAPLRPGQAGFFLGTDLAGRSLAARVIWGARYTLVTALGALLIRTLLSAAAGLLASRAERLWERLVTVPSAGINALPLLVLTGIIMNGLRNTIYNPTVWLTVYMVLLALPGVPGQAEQLLQTERGWLPLTRLLIGDMARILGLMGALSLFGITVGAPVIIELGYHQFFTVEYIPEWGQMVGANVGQLATAPWIPLAPALALIAATSCFYLLGEGLERLIVPREAPAWPQTPRHPAYRPLPENR